MSRFPSLEGSSLKRKGSIPPDVYCQRNEQKEDTLSEDFVRDGYKYLKPVRDEYESCREESKFVSSDALWNFFYTVMTHKYECFGDQDLKKRQTNIRDSVVPVIDMNKGRNSEWFKELAGSVPLQTLKRRVPYSKDKDEILGELLNNKVPVSRALWFINTSIIQISAMAENAKKKPRAPLDPTVEWTASVCRKLTGILENSIIPDLVSSDTTVPVSEADWNYFFSLLIAMYNVDIADRWEVLVWLVKTAEGLPKLLAGTVSSPGNTNNTGAQVDGPTASPQQQQHTPRVIFTDSQPALLLKFFLFQLVRVGNWFRESELLSRRLLYWCCNILQDIVFTSMPANVEYPSQTSERGSLPQAVIRAYASVMHTCPLHAIVISSLGGLITCLVCNCPSAAVWNSIPIETEQTYITGSPLDFIPLSLVYLPMPPGCESSSIRKCLAEVEKNIITRGRLVQLGWNRQAMTSSSNGEGVERMVRLLDILDGQDFYILKEVNPMEALYNRIFKDDTVHADTGTVVTLLCEWAVSTHRIGIHRPIIVACILEHLVESFRSETGPRRLLQNTLINFLDSYTKHLPPFTTEQAPVDNESMRSLVCLFAELVDREIFDHDGYVRHFIARGAFDIGSQPPLVSETSSAGQSNAVTSVTSSMAYTPTGNQSLVGSLPLSTRGSGGVTQVCMGTSSLTAAAQCSVASELSEDNDRCSVENPDSVRSELAFPSAATTLGVGTHQQQSQQTSVPRSGHLHYLVQFPIPQDEAYSHEQNQRSRLLYGSVRMRDRARSRVRRLYRDIVKMLTRKTYLMDVVHGEVCRRRKPKERDRDKEVAAAVGVNTAGNLATPATATNQSKGQGDEARSTEELHQDIRTRFLSLSFYDMECVISQCTPMLVKVLNGCNAVAAASSATTGGSGASAATAASFTSLPSAEDINNNLTGTTSANPASPSIASTLNNNTSSGGGNLSYLYMPYPKSIFLFFELIETSSNITCLVATIVDTLEKLHALFDSRTQFMTLYMSALCLRAISLFQRYQPVLLTMGDLSCRLFRTLIEQVRQVKEPTQCGPFERCVLAYLNDLFNSSVLIKTRFTSIYGKAHHKVAALFRNAGISGEGATTFDPNYANELLNSVSSDNLAMFRACAEDLRVNSQCRFSFVCRAIICICQAKTNERLDYLCSLCAEMTSQCGELTSEWLRALYAVLASRTYPHSYSPLVELNDLTMYDSLSSLVGTLLSRYCFTISDFLCLVICPAMAQGLDHTASPVGSPLEPVIRLACHILHRLFTAELPGSTVTTATTASSSVQMPNQQDSTGGAGSVDVIATPPVFRILEPLLLTGALQKVTSEFLIDLLKLLIVHSDKTAMDSGMPLDPHNTSGDAVGQGSDSDDQRQPHGEAGDEDGGAGATGDGDSDEASLSDDYPRGGDTDGGSRRRRGKASSNSSRRKQSGRQQWHGRRGQTQASSNSPSTAAAVRVVNHPVVQRFLESGTLPTTTELQNLPLGGLIQLVLRVICTASWVRERFAQMSPEFLTRDNVLIDKNFSHSQARHLLHIICSPYDLTWTDIALSSREGLASAMCSVLSSLNQWSMRSVQMKVELLKAQINFSQQSEVLGHVAQSLVHGFQTQALNWLTLSDSSGLFIDGSVGPIGGLPNFEVDENDKVWLLPALMAKLPRAMKTPIVKATLEMLKGIRQFWKHKNDEDKETVLLKHSIILAHPAFFALLQLCIQDHDPIYDMPEQIDYFVQNARETEDRVPDNLRTRQVVQECLRLRLTLVGQRFATIQSDPDVCSRWALLLTQLITHGVTEPESNSTLFYMVLDMLQTLIHTLVARSGLEGKYYLNVVKKIRRELAERPSCSGIEHIRPLLIPSKTAYSLFVTGRRLGAGGSTGVGGSGSLSGSGGVQSLGGGGSVSGGGGGGAGGMGKSSGAGKSSYKVGAVGCSKSTGNQTNARGRRGYTVVNKECFAPWELLDPNRQSSLLLKHGAIRTEALPSHAEEQVNRLIVHDHYVNTRRQPQFYLCPFYPETEEVQSAASLNDCSNASSVEATPSSSTTNDAMSAVVSTSQRNDTAVRVTGADVDGGAPKRAGFPENAENRTGSSHSIPGMRGTKNQRNQGQADLTPFHSENAGSAMSSHGSVRTQMQQHSLMTSKAGELEGYLSIPEGGNRSTRQLQSQQLLDPNSGQTQGQISSMQDYHGCDMHALPSSQHLMQATSHAADMNYPLSAQTGHFGYDQSQPTAVFNHPAMMTSDGRGGVMQQQSAATLPTSTATTTSSMMMIVMDRGYQVAANQAQQQQQPHAQHIVGSDSAVPSKTVKYMPNTRMMPGQLMGMATPNQEVHLHQHQQRQQTQSVAMVSSSSVTQPPPPKRKRGSGRRNIGAAASGSTAANLATSSTSTVANRGGFRVAGSHQLPAESHPFLVQSGAAYEFPSTTAAVPVGVAGDEDVWFVKSEGNPCILKPDMRGRAGGTLSQQPMSKNASHSTNIAGFLRNRGRQQQQQQQQMASVQQKHHMYSGPFSQAQQQQQHLDLNCHRVIQQSDGVMVPGQSYGITDQDGTSFAYSLNSDVTSSTYNEPGMMGSQVPRSGIGMSAAKPQQIPCDPVTYSTPAMPPTVQTTIHPQSYRLPPQVTPNPPPYPATSHQAHLGQQHSFHPRSTADDTYFLVMDPPGCEDVYQQQQAQRQQVSGVYPGGGHTQAMPHPHHQLHHTQHTHHLQPHQQTLVAQEQMHMMPGGTACLASSQACHQPLMVNTRSAQQQPLTLMTMVPANATVATVVSQTASKMPTTAAHPQQMHYSQYPNF